MRTHSRVLSALFLLLLYSTQILGKQCALTMSRPSTLDPRYQGFVLHAGCEFRDPVRHPHGYDTKVKLTIKVAKPMQGWQIDLQLNVQEPLRVKSVSGGDLIGSETRKNGSITLRNTVPRLDALDTFRVGFVIRHGQRNKKLFPANLRVNLPLPRHIIGVCDGARVTSPPSSGFKLLLGRGSGWVMLTLTFGNGIGRWMSCKLTFDVPIHFTVLRNAEYVGQEDERNYVIGVKPTHAVIIYQKLGSNGSKTGHIGSECYKCRWDHNIGRFHVATLPPYIEPYTEPVEQSGDFTPTQVTDLDVMSTRERTRIAVSATSTATTNVTPNLTNGQQIPLPQDVTEYPAVRSNAINGHTETLPTKLVIHQMPATSETLEDSSSSSSQGTWIGVAAGCAIAIIVLLIVVAALLVSRRKSNQTASSNSILQGLRRTRENERSNNVYYRDGQVAFPTHDHATVSNRALPCTPYASADLVKGKCIPEETQYEELEVYCPDDKNSKLTNGGGMIAPPSKYDSPLLPGQRLNLMKESKYDNLSSLQTSPYSNSAGHYSVPHPSQTQDDIIESGDEDEVEYMSMDNPNRKNQHQT